MKHALVQFRHAAMAMAVAVLGLVFLASPASAHHPVVTGKAECNPATGKYTVTWTIDSDDPGRDKYWKLVSVSRSIGLSAPTGLQKESKSFGGSEEVAPGAGTLELTVTAHWEDKHGGGVVEQTKSGSVAIPPSPCDDDSKTIDYCHWDNGNQYGNHSNGSIPGLVNGHMDHPNDIWPAFDYQGTHYAAQGDQSILENGCSVPKVKDAEASVSVQDPTCESGSVAAFSTTHATANPATPDQSPGTHQVVFAAEDGHTFANGEDNKTLSYTIQPKLDADDAYCQGLIEVTPSVAMHDQCGTSNDSGPDYVHENEYWTAETVGSAVVFTAKPGWKFPDGPHVSHHGKTWTEYVEKNSDDACEVPVPPKPEVEDPCGVGNATWVVPEDTDTLDWELGQDGHLRVTVTTPETVFTGSYSDTHDYGTAYEKNTEPCPVPIETVPTVSMHDECGTSNDSGPTWPESDQYTGEDNGDGTVTFTANPPYHFVGSEGEPVASVDVSYTPNTEVPCTTPVPEQPAVMDACGVGNAAWVVPADTETFSWELGEDGHLRVTVLTSETVFEGSDSAVHDFGPAPESNTEDCPVAIETVPEVTMVDNCGTADDSGPTWAESAQYTGVDDGDGTVTFTANPPYHFVGSEGEPLPAVDVSYTPNTDEACPPEVEGEQEESPGPKDEPQVPTAPEVKGVQAPAASVPTSVDAGLASLPGEPVGRNPLWLVLVGAGIGLMGFAGLRRRGLVRR